MNMRDIMTPNVVCVYKSDSLAKTTALMETTNTHHLLVVEKDGSLVGIVSDRDCKRALSSPFATYDKARAQAFAEKILVEHIMTAQPICSTPQMSVQEAADLMVEKRIHALPVLHDSTVIGIVTSTDLLKVLASLPEVVNA